MVFRSGSVFFCCFADIRQKTQKLWPPPLLLLPPPPPELKPPPPLPPPPKLPPPLLKLSEELSELR